MVIWVHFTGMLTENSMAHWRDEQGNLLTANAEKAELLNNYFVVYLLRITMLLIIVDYLRKFLIFFSLVCFIPEFTAY